MIEPQENRPTHPLLHPMQAAGRTREPHVEQQITRLLHSSPYEVRRCLQLRDREHSDWIQEESLVALLRVKRRTGDEAAMWEMVELLVERSAGFLDRQIRIWRLSPANIEDCLSDVQAQMLKDLMDDAQGCEFWEVKFWLCLKRRLLNAVKKYRERQDAEITAYSTSDDEDAGDDLLTRLPDNRRLAAPQCAEIADALAILPEHERVAFVLTHYESWQQQEIADHLGVQDRTVRNWLTRAEKRLTTWRTDN